MNISYKIKKYEWKYQNSSNNSMKVIYLQKIFFYKNLQLMVGSNVFDLKPNNHLPSPPHPRLRIPIKFAQNRHNQNHVRSNLSDQQAIIFGTTIWNEFMKYFNYDFESSDDGTYDRNFYPNSNFTDRDKRNYQHNFDNKVFKTWLGHQTSIIFHSGNYVNNLNIYDDGIILFNWLANKRNDITNTIFDKSINQLFN